MTSCRSQWPRCLRRRSMAARLLRLWVRIRPGAWMFVCSECRVLSGRGLCEKMVTRPEESCRLWCVVVCDLETSWMRRPWPTVGCRSKNKSNMTSEPSSTLCEFRFAFRLRNACRNRFITHTSHACVITMYFKHVPFHLFPQCGCIRKMFRSKSGFIWTYLSFLSFLNTLEISVCCYRNSKQALYYGYWLYSCFLNKSQKMAAGHVGKATKGEINQ